MQRAMDVQLDDQGASEAGSWAGSCSRLRHAAQRGGAEVRGRFRDLFAGPPTDIKEMHVNRPFFFGTYDHPTSTWLFLGDVVAP
jgi:hypothetical protein